MCPQPTVNLPKFLLNVPKTRLCKSILKLFNLSLFAEVFPDSWEGSFTLPLCEHCGRNKLMWFSLLLVKQAKWITQWTIHYVKWAFHPVGWYDSQDLIGKFKLPRNISVQSEMPQSAHFSLIWLLLFTNDFPSVIIHSIVHIYMSITSKCSAVWRKW